jgi:lysophospholipase L1-like esterase
MPQRARGLARKALMGLVVAGAALGLAELLIRLAVPERWLLFSWERPEGFLEFVDEADEENRYRHAVIYTRPDFVDRRGIPGEPVHYFTNARGLREDREVPERAEPGCYRILALGDSWIYGIGQTQGMTVADHLERLLPERLRHGRVEVINAGVPGSAAFDMLRRWESLAGSYELDAVLLGRPHNRLRQIEASEARDGWYESLLGAPHLDLGLYLLLRRMMAPWTHSPARWTHSEDEMLTGLEDIVRLAERIQQRGLPIWMMLSPNPDWSGRQRPAEQRRARDREDNQPWVQALEPLGVRFAGHALLERACWGLDDLTHPSASGALSLAEQLAEVMASGGSAVELAERPPCRPLAEVLGERPDTRQGP